MEMENIFEQMNRICAQCENAGTCDSYWNYTGNCITFLETLEKEEEDK